MADYIYLLQTRLTPAQQSALQHVRDAAKSRGMTVFLDGGAVRDLTGGAPIRDLDVAVQGNATKLKKDLQKFATLIGENEPAQTLYFNFPGGVRFEVGSTLSVTFPKPGKPVYKPATILDDLRRRDFTANAMAISLNEGSFGLLMDPLNGVADLENREFRLVSNYGFIEDPARMIRAQRLSARLGWHLEEKTQQRYENGKAENYIAALNPFQRSYEIEEIFHEEDPLRVMRRLESEGWTNSLFPAWTSAKANETEVNRLRDLAGQLELMGIHPDPSAIQFPLLTAKLAPKDVAALKKLFARPGFVDQIAALEPATKAFAALFTSKAAAAPSDAWKLLYAAAPETVLSLAHSSKSAPVQAKFTAFFKEWSQARNKIPYQLMQEMRIVPDLPIYSELLEKLFYAIMDGKLDSPEAARAFLEPFSPPAPPPPVSLRRRAVKREAKTPKPRAKKAAAAVPVAEAPPEPEPPPPAPAPPAAKPAPAKAVKQAAPSKEAAKPAAPVKATPPAKPATPPSKPVKAAAKPTAKPAPKATKPAPKPAARKAVPAKKPAKAAAKLVKKALVKSAAKSAAKKAVAKKVVKPAAKKVVPAKNPAKPAPKPAKKPQPKPAAKKAAKKAVKARGRR
jgi:tRNA nucleotidyltransferase (CCA-adding enzyme)